eukprot:7272214-Prymnesium_polylepis.1
MREPLVTLKDISIHLRGQTANPNPRAENGSTTSHETRLASERETESQSQDTRDRARSMRESFLYDAPQPRVSQDVTFLQTR